MNQEEIEMSRNVFTIAILLCIGLGSVTGGTLNVPADHPTIKDAYAAATAGDIIQVAAGTYSDAYMDFTKPITLKGANAGIPGTSGSRGAETIWRAGGSTVELQCDNVIIDGFRIEPTSNRWMNNNHDANGFQFINNVVECSSAGSNVFQTEGAVSYRDWVIQDNYFLIQDKTMLFLGGGGSAADFTNLLIKGNKIEGNQGGFIFWAAGTPSNFRFHENECINVVAMNAGKVGDLSVKGNTFTNSYYTAFQCGIVGGEVVNNVFDGGDPWCPYGANLFELWGGEWGTPVSSNVLVSGNTFIYNNSAACPVNGPRLRDGADAPTITFQNNKWIDQGALPDAKAIRNQGAGTLFVDINDWNSPDGHVVHNFSGDIDFADGFIYNGQTVYGPRIFVTVFHDPNENGQVDVDELGLKNVLVRIPKPDKDTKHLTNQHGKCMFENLNFTTYSVELSADDFPNGVYSTTGGWSTEVTVSAADNFPRVTFGLAGDGIEDWTGSRVIELSDDEEQYDPNDLVFVTGSPTAQGYKYDMGWSNAVDKDTEGSDGTVWACADESTGDDVPWAIFEFYDQNIYKFDYALFQTDNGTDDNQSGHVAYQTRKIQVLVSTTGTEMDDFEAVGTFKRKYGTHKMQWCTLDRMVEARYIKLRLLAPVAEGKMTQIVEFAVDTHDKTGPVATSHADPMTLLETPGPELGNHPNPFNPVTTISFRLKEASDVTVRVYDIRGKQVTELVNGYRRAGRHQVTFDASNLPSGVYFYQLNAGSVTEMKRMLLIK
jgi:hypothetical protein